MEQEPNADQIKIEEISQLRNRFLSDFEGGEHLDKCMARGAVLKDKYPDHEDYALYHILIGSSIDREYKYLDFPGEDSVELFIKRLYYGR